LFFKPFSRANDSNDNKVLAEVVVDVVIGFDCVVNRDVVLNGVEVVVVVIKDKL
jgi:hypothetical protein